MIERYGRIYATIDLDAIRSNMDSMQAKLSEGTKVIGVIKMDGYGHGAVPIAKELEPLWYMYGFATATAEEVYDFKGCRDCQAYFGFGVCVSVEL